MAQIVTGGLAIAIVIMVYITAEAFAQVYPNPYRQVEGWAKLPGGRMESAERNTSKRDHRRNYGIANSFYRRNSTGKEMPLPMRASPAPYQIRTVNRDGYVSTPRPPTPPALR